MPSVGERYGLLPDPEFTVCGCSGKLTVSRKSLFSGRTNTMTLPIDHARFMAWRRGEYLIQDAFPDLSAEEREFLMSGATPEEWDAEFKEE